MSASTSVLSTSQWLRLNFSYQPHCLTSSFHSMSLMSFFRQKENEIYTNRYAISSEHQNYASSRAMVEKICEEFKESGTWSGCSKEIVISSLKTRGEIPIVRYENRFYASFYPETFFFFFFLFSAIWIVVVVLMLRLLCVMVWWCEDGEPRSNEDDDER